MVEYLKVHKPRGKIIETDCHYCGKLFTVRQAEINRGRGKFCTKSCKAYAQGENSYRDRSLNFH